MSEVVGAGREGRSTGSEGARHQADQDRQISDDAMYQGEVEVDGM